MRASVRDPIMTGFHLHPRLAQDCHPVGDLPLSRVLLLNDRRYPWLILVPRRAGIQEIYQLAAVDRGQLLTESCETAEAMVQSFGGDKLNIGTLGNLVPQLHVHHVIRRREDPAWPGPVWGHSAAEPYTDDELTKRLAVVRTALGIDG